MVNSEEKGWKFAICSFENEPPYILPSSLASTSPSRSSWYPRLTPDELDRGKDLCGNISFLYQNDGSLATIEGIIERLKIAVMRHGIRGAINDPSDYIQKWRYE